MVVKVTSQALLQGYIIILTTAISGFDVSSALQKYCCYYKDMQKPAASTKMYILAPKVW